MVIVVFQFSTNPKMSDEYFKEVELLKKEIKKTVQKRFYK